MFGADIAALLAQPSITTEEMENLGLVTEEEVLRTE
jgi:hypothetical protein